MTIIKIAKSSQKSSTTFSLLPPALFSLSFLISMTVTRISKIPQRNFSIFSLLHHIPIFPLSFLISMINIGNSKNPEKNFIITFSPQRVFRVCREILFLSPFPLPILVPSICILFLDPRDYHEFQGVGDDD